MKPNFKKIIAREFLLLTSVGAFGLIIFFCIYPYNLYQDHRITILSRSINEMNNTSDSLMYDFNKKNDNQTWLFKQQLEKIGSHFLWKVLDSLYSNDIIPANTTYDVFINNYTSDKAQVTLWNILYSRHLYTKSSSQFKEQYFSKNQDIFTPEFQNSRSLWLHLENLTLKDSINFRYLNIWDEIIKNKLVEIGFESPGELSRFILQNRISPNDSLNYKNATNINYEISGLEKSLVKRKNQIVSSRSQKLHICIKSMIFLFIILFPLRYLLYSIKWSIKILKTEN